MRFIIHLQISTGLYKICIYNINKYVYLKYMFKSIIHKLYSTKLYLTLLLNLSHALLDRYVSICIDVILRILDFRILVQDII
jgi:hypothetical protein